MRTASLTAMVAVVAIVIGLAGSPRAGLAFAFFGIWGVLMYWGARHVPPADEEQTDEKETSA